VTIIVILERPGAAIAFIRAKVEEKFPAPTEVMHVTSISSNPGNSSLMLRNLQVFCSFSSASTRRASPIYSESPMTRHPSVAARERRRKNLAKLVCGEQYPRPTVDD
jgi:hypothetical protein